MSKKSKQIPNESLDAAIILAALQEEAAPLLKQLARIKIEDGESYNLKSAKIDSLKQLGKMAAAKRASLTDPLTKVIKDIRQLFEPFERLVSSEEVKIKAEMLEYVGKVERLKAKVKTDLESGKIARLSTAVRKTAELEINAPSSSIRRIWVARPIDESVTPREYLIPDEQKIKAALKAGKKVLGWEYVQETTIAI